PLAADVGEREDAAAAPLLHERRHRARQPDERIGADVERDPETFTRGLHEWIVEIRRRRKCGAVHEEVEAAKLAVDVCGELFDLPIARYVARQDQRVLELFCQLP